jgi:hypothetical protein
MPYLVVHGPRNWGGAFRDTGSWSAEGETYPVGIHEVSEHIAEIARNTNLAWVYVTDELPPSAQLGVASEFRGGMRIGPTDPASP